LAGIADESRVHDLYASSPSLSLMENPNISRHCGGHVGKKPVGTMGFGYDPLFYPKGLDMTLGQMSPEEKDSLSHRRDALEKLKTYLKSCLYNYLVPL